MAIFFLLLLLLFSLKQAVKTFICKPRHWCTVKTRTKSFWMIGYTYITVKDYIRTTEIRQSTLKSEGTVILFFTSSNSEYSSIYSLLSCRYTGKDVWTQILTVLICRYWSIIKIERSFTLFYKLVILPIVRFFSSLSNYYNISFF